VVASRVGAIPEIIVDGESGYLVEVGDLFDWRNKLETLISDAEKRSQMGMAARTRIESCFTADSMSRKYHSLVHKAVHR